MTQAERTKMETREIKWISVREKLPSYGQMVLAYSADSYNKIETLQVYNAGNSEGGISIGHDFQSERVTHWASLPTPPIEKGVEPLKKIKPKENKIPHENGDYSKPCGRDYCKCMQ